MPCSTLIKWGELGSYLNLMCQALLRSDGGVARKVEGIGGGEGGGLWLMWKMNKNCKKMSSSLHIVLDTLSSTYNIQKKGKEIISPVIYSGTQDSLSLTMVNCLQDVSDELSLPILIWIWWLTSFSYKGQLKEREGRIHLLAIEWAVNRLNYYWGTLYNKFHFHLLCLNFSYNST